jgi:TonB-linked SusC/RagA family outer membrane protein
MQLNFIGNIPHRNCLLTKKNLLVMKLMVLLLTITCLQVSARGYGQEITLKKKNVSLEKVFEKIYRQTGYQFVYTYDLLSHAKKVTIDADKTPLKEVLAACFKDQPFTYQLMGNAIIVKRKMDLTSSAENIQPIQIKGRVTDNKGNPLIGVTIKVKSGGTGTATDANGNYSLTVPDNSVLVVSYVGFETQDIAVNGRREINIVLKPEVSTLTQLVVVGYGVQKKVDMTGSVAVVGKKILENRPVSNAIQALQGAAPGLVVTRTNGQPGEEGWNINIRGYSSLNGTNSPLVIIDGVPGDLSDINPDDIASISVLKDAAAASIYGAKSSGGVILVTTKTGAKGKLTVNYTGLYTIKQTYDLPQRIPSWEEGEMANVARENAELPDAWTQQQLGFMKGTDSNFIYNSSIPSLNGFYFNLNQAPLILRTSSPSWTHNVSVSGGDAKTDYFISLGYYHEDGAFKIGPDGYNRYNARVNLTNHFNSIFSLNSRISYTQALTQSPNVAVNNDYGLLYNLFQLRQIYPIWLPGTNDTKYAQTGSGSTIYEQLKDGGYRHQSQYNFDGVFTLQAANLVKGLDLRAIYSPHLQQYNNDQFSQTIPLWSYNKQGVPVIANYLNNPNYISKERQTILNHDVQLLADYDWRVATNHHFHILGGFEYQFYDYDDVGAAQSNLISNNIPSLNLQASANNPPSVGDNIQTNAWVSYFGRLNYDFKGKYLIQATVRNDASSRLAPGHRSQTFPSVSAGWVVSQEPWFNNALPFFNELKLRGSWGEQGNAQLGKDYQNNYNYIGVLNQGGAYPFNNVSNPSVYQSALPSPSIGWETIKESDGGLDIALFNDRLTGSFDYYVRNNDNMLIALNEPAVLGVAPSTSNAASLRTWGWGFNVGWQDKVGEVSYYVNFNLDNNNNKITRYLGNVVVGAGTNTAIPGYPIHSIFGYGAQGYFQTQDQVTKHAFQDTRTGPGDLIYRDINGDGKINQGNNTLDNHGDLVYLGNTSPRLNFGENMGVTYKGFDFSVFFQGVGKRNYMIYGYTIVPFINSWRMPWAINQDYWTPANPNAKFPRLYQGGTQNTVISSHWVQNAAYIDLKNIQLGYTIPERLTKKIKITKARIYFSGQDIWEATKAWYKYYNPESPDNASFEYPFFRSYAFGINVTL